MRCQAIVLVLVLLNLSSVGSLCAQSQRELVLRQLEDSEAKYTTQESWDARRRELREGFLRGSGLWPLPERTPLNPIIHSRRMGDGYVVENVALETMPGFFCTGNLYRPAASDRPGPGVLCPHGHFKPLGRMRPEQQIRCAHLARMGATVFSYSMVGWQDSQQTTHDDPLVLALQTWNSTRALDFLSSLPEVDPLRLAVTGASGGATQTFFLAALDDRVRVSAPAVIVYPWTAPDGCKCEGGLPVMQSTHTNAIELAASVSPRAQLLISCGGDETRDFPSVGFPFIKRVYDIHGSGRSVENVHLADEGHDYGPSKRRALYAFFAKHLGLRNLDEDLSKIRIEEPAQMAVFDEQHPLPSQAVRGSEQVAQVFRALARPAATASSPAERTGQNQPEGDSFFFVPPGFDREGKPISAAGDAVGRIKIVVRDAANNEPTPCRLNVVGPDGNFYQPPGDHLSPYALTGQWPAQGAWGNRKEKAPYRYLGRFFYSSGQVEVAVPPGRTRVEVWKGYEYQPQSQTVEVTAEGTQSVTFQLKHSIDMPQLGYYSGDLHLHIPRESERDESTIFDLLAAEDIRFGCILGYNEPAGPYAGLTQKMHSPQQRGLGQASILERGGYSLISGQEYRSTTYGHLLVYHRDDLLFPRRSFNADNWPVYGEVGRDTHSQGGYTVHAHGGYGQEIYADAALGTVDAVELLQFGIYRGIGLEDWYHMLNTGYHFPSVGASDWPACRFLGDCRTYVYQAQRAGFSQWLRGAVSGHSFVTTGPMLLLEVDGQPPGSRIQKNGVGRHSVTARIRMRCDVTPVRYVQLVVNGRVAEPRELPPPQRQGAWHEWTIRIDVPHSVWIAARAYSTTPGNRPDAEAHTNPVYVYVDQRAPYDQTSLDAWVAKIDSEMTVHRKRSFPEKARVLDYFQQARDLLLKIRERGGLRFDDDPVKLAADMTPSAGRSRLAGDASVPDPSEIDLHEFLKPVPPKTPQEALRSFETVDGFRLELVAAEPHVFDPVAASFDENGNLYVCEMRDYPYKPVEGHKPIGSIRLLRDTDGDGTFDRSTVYADELLWAAGVAPWKGGAFVAAPPDIWYLKDTTGDDRADVRQQVYTGFGIGNQQAMVNNLVWWLDHKIYGATAGNGGEIRRGADFASLFPNAPPPPSDALSVSGRDFRFDPVTGVFETLSGTVQFGNTFDDWGHRFVCSESQPLQHVVLQQHYLARNPYLPVPSAINNVARGPVPIFRISPIERWRQIRTSRRITNQERSAESAGASHHVVDAAAGVTVYRGGAYPPRYYGTVFVGDGQNNLVHHRQLVPDGVTHQSKRMEQGTEFVRSADLWFRPVNFVNAPDGTLYCLDMSREVLESIHIPLDVVKHLDLASGRNYGRIYRIAPPGFRSPPPPKLSQSTGRQLVTAIESPHGWWRDTAVRLIFERQDRSLVPHLQQLATHSHLPQARLCALWSLQGLNQLSEQVVLAALSDSNPGVRENAIRLCEPLLHKPSDKPMATGTAHVDQAATDNTGVGAGHSALLEKLLTLVDDPEPVVRFQLALSLGATDDGRAIATLARLAVRDGGDTWMRTAILSSAANSAAQLFANLSDNRAALDNGAGVALLEHLSEVVGVRNRNAEVRQLLELIATANAFRERVAVQEQLAVALGRGQKRADARLTTSDVSAETADWLARLLDNARRTSTNEQSSESDRVGAIQLLSCGPFVSTRETLMSLLEPRHPQAVQLAAVRALSDYSEPDIAELLLRSWRQYAPDVRSEALRALLAREDRTVALFESAERGEASVAEIDSTRRELLLKHRNEKLRSFAAQLFGTQAPSPRASILADYRPALRLASDVSKGQSLFNAHCSACHQLNGKGFAIGPNLASSPVRDPEALLTHILDPNQYVLPNYIQYTAVDKHGRIFTGLIAAQTATSITLRREKDSTDTILRADLDELTSTGKSLMPEGLEKNISQQDMADLLAYLTQAVREPGDPNRQRDFGTLPGLIEPGK